MMCPGSKENNIISLAGDLCINSLTISKLEDAAEKNTSGGDVLRKERFFKRRGSTKKLRRPTNKAGQGGPIT